MRGQRHQQRRKQQNRQWLPPLSLNLLGVHWTQAGWFGGRGGSAGLCGPLPPMLSALLAGLLCVLWQVCVHLWER